MPCWRKIANLAMRFLLELYAAGRPVLAWALVVLYVINRVLMYVWGK
jgi:hypothetical protein